MPQVQTTVSTPVGYVIATMQARITSMLTAMQTGKSIAASDVQGLITTYNEFVAHSHSANDLQGQDIYGNLTTYGTTGQTTAKSSSAPSNGSTYSSSSISVTSGTTIDATTLNSIIGLINAVRSHYHTIDDTAGATYAVPALVSAGVASQNYDTLAGAPVSLNMTFNNVGSLLTDANVADQTNGKWLNMAPTDTGSASIYEIYVTATTAGSGSVTNGPFSTWLSLGTNRVFTANIAPDDSQVANFHVQIRAIGTTTVLASADYGISLNGYAAAPPDGSTGP